MQVLNKGNFNMSGRSDKGKEMAKTGDTSSQKNTKDFIKENTKPTRSKEMIVNKLKSLIQESSTIHERFYNSETELLTIKFAAILKYTNRKDREKYFDQEKHKLHGDFLSSYSDINRRITKYIEESIKFLEQKNMHRAASMLKTQHKEASKTSRESLSDKHTEQPLHILIASAVSKNKELKSLADVVASALQHA